ncbi:F-box protein PP2-B13-like [Salvia hispanica]|uniref:F-box protein PP2-B13-like n=1 Tax=Salvia hispanica TaxID=49212 RepID=UPI0020092466|nr:F-box protein PP2-B13-like [Salvia hispanica]
MSKHYDNWERLVVAVLRRQQDREIALCPSTDSSAFSSRSSSFSREFYDHLHDAIIKNQNIPFSLSTYTSYLEDERNGKKSYMVGAKDLIITFGNNSVKWQWRFDDNYSREVAEMCSPGRFDVRAKIAAGTLNPRTVYGAYLVYKLRETAEGWRRPRGV